MKWVYFVAESADEAFIMYHQFLCNACTDFHLNYGDAKTGAADGSYLYHRDYRVYMFAYDESWFD